MSFESIVGISLSDILKAAVAALLPVVVVFGKKYLSNLLETFSKRVNIAGGQQKLEEARDAVRQVVAYVEQTFVEKQKSLGDFDDESREQAFDKAVELAKSLLNKETLAFISQTYEDIDTWLHTRIELEVRNISAGRENQTSPDDLSEAG